MGILAKGSEKEKVCRERTFRALMAALPEGDGRGQRLAGVKRMVDQELLNK